MSAQAESRLAFARLTGASIGAGLVYSLSPLTAWFVLAMLLVFRWAGHGLSGRERRWVVGLLVLGLAFRLVAIAVLIVSTEPGRDVHPSFFGDGRYAISRSLWIRNVWIGAPVFPGYFFEAFGGYGSTGYFYFLAALQVIVGSAPYGVHLVSIAFFLTGAVLCYRIVRASYGGPAALVGFLVLLFIPSMFAWSVSPIKEAFQFLLVALCFAATLKAVRAHNYRTRLLAAAVVLAALGAIGTLRSGGVLMTGAGLLVGSALRLMTVRRRVIAAALLVILVAGAYLATRPAVQNRVAAEVRLAAVRHIGNVFTPGTSYRLLEQRFYSEGPDAASTMTRLEAVRFLSRSLAAFVLAPLPWQLTSHYALLLLPQQIAWYCLVLLAAVGFWAGIQCDPLLTWILMGYIAVSVAVIAPNSGNVGTLIRHRDMVVPFVVWLSSLGVCTVLSQVTGITLAPRPERRP